MPSCGGDWIEDWRGSFMSEGERWYVEYRGGWPPEPEPFFFVLSDNSAPYVVEEAGVPLWGAPFAVIIPRQGRQAEQLIPTNLIVPKGFAGGDVELQVARIRFCGLSSEKERSLAEAQEAERKRDIETGNVGGVAGVMDRIKATLEAIRTGAITAGAIAAVIALLILLTWAGVIRSNLTS